MIQRIANLIDAFAPADGPPPQKLMAFFHWGLGGAWGWLWFAAILSAVVGTLEVFTAIILGAVIDAALASGVETFWSDNAVMIIGAALFFLVIRPIGFASSSAANSILVQPNINPLVLTRLHRWTMGQSVSFFDDDFAGRIAQKQMQTARALTDVAVETINVIFFALASIVGSVLLLTAINGWIAVGLGVWLVAYILLIRWFMPQIRVRSKDRAAARAMVTGQIVDTITNIKTVKLFAHADHEDRAAIGAISGFRDTSIHFGVLSAAFRFALMTLAGILPVLMIGATLWLWSKGTASPGDVAAAGTIAIRIAQMTGWVSFVLMVIYANIGEVEDGMKTLTPPYSMDDRPGAGELSKAGTIEFDNVTYAYGREAGGGIQDINLTIKPGERVGIVGPSGAGKSTLVATLLRLHDVEAGSVRMGGVDLRDVTQESLRRRIGMVTQDTAMFNRSARDNIRYGRHDATDAEVEDAAKNAEAHDFILDLEDHKGRQAYEAHLGERGVKLSGGQRQRIALARAILKDAPVLVLDEATSALDSDVEAEIQQALDRVIEGKTVLAIAHRLSTIARMDRIVVMNEGRIVEQGTHAELLAKRGTYARLWDRQTGGFLAAE